MPYRFDMKAIILSVVSALLILPAFTQTEVEKAIAKQQALTKMVNELANSPLHTQRGSGYSQQGIEVRRSAEAQNRAQAQAQAQQAACEQALRAELEARMRRERARIEWQTRTMIESALMEAHINR